MRSRDSIVYTPVSLGPDTDDEETLVNAEVYNNGEFQFERISIAKKSQIQYWRSAIS